MSGRDNTSRPLSGSRHDLTCHARGQTSLTRLTSDGSEEKTAIVGEDEATAAIAEACFGSARLRLVIGITSPLNSRLNADHAWLFLTGAPMELDVI